MSFTANTADRFKGDFILKNDQYKHYIFEGTHREVGLQHGEALRDQIRKHIELIYSLAEEISGISKAEVLANTRQFEPYIEKYAPGFVEEIKGLAEGAGLTEEEALLLQVRQEVVYLTQYGECAPECTSYAIGTRFTGSDSVYSGQNADLAGNFEDFSNVITFAVTGKPKIMMIVPAGQISYLGINDRGMGVNCNFLACTGWQKGYPRYLISRLLLEKETFEAARCTMSSISERASSRNVLLTDCYGNIADFEVTTENIGRIEVEDMFVHSNHFIDPFMTQYEKSTELEMIDSKWRLDRLTQLIKENKGAIDIDKVKGFLRDHKVDDEVGKFSLCMHACEETEYYHTFASIINDLKNSAMEIAKGNPCESEYVRYEF